MPKKPTADKARRKSASVTRRMASLGAPADELARRAKALPSFEPIDLRSLVLAARKKTGPESIDRKIESVLSDRLKDQTEQLLWALGLAPEDCEWRLAFMHLARIHHGLGRLVHTPKRTNSNAQRYTTEDDLRLMSILDDLQAEGIKRPEAFETIADRPELRKQFPAYTTRSQIKGKDKLAKSLSERARKFESRQRALRQGRLLTAIMGSWVDPSEIEALLSWLDAQASKDTAKNEND
jgi:hypothetical protein